MNENPLVTVNILSYNRKVELRNTLNKVFEQDYKNIEVIVVDNASSDGSPEMVEEEFTDVNLIKLKANIGIAGWNRGFEAAKGEYVLVLDDDSYPAKDAIVIAIKRIYDFNNLGILELNVFNQKLEMYERGLRKDARNNFNGCGSIINKEVFSNIGYYEDILFLYSHEIEFSMRLLNAKYEIHFEPNSIIYHELADNYSGEKRSLIDDRKLYYFTRNNLIILILHFNVDKILFRVTRIVIGNFIWGIIYFKFGFIKSIFSFIQLLPKLLKKRRKVDLGVQKLYEFGRFAGGFFNTRIQNYVENATNK